MKKSIITLVVVITAFCSCKRYCADIPDEIVSYFPFKYYDDNIVSFVDDSNDTVQFKTNNFLLRQEQQYIERCSKCLCDSYYRASLSHFDSVGQYNSDTGELMSYTPVTIKFEFEISPKLQNHGGKTRPDEDDYDFSSYYSVYGQNVNCFSYLKVIHRSDSLILVAENENPEYDSLIVVRGTGLTSFKTAEGKKYTVIRP